MCNVCRVGESPSAVFPETHVPIWVDSQDMGCSRALEALQLAEPRPLVVPPFMLSGTEGPIILFLNFFFFLGPLTTRAPAGAHPSSLFNIRRLEDSHSHIIFISLFLFIYISPITARPRTARLECLRLFSLLLRGAHFVCCEGV